MRRRMIAGNWKMHKLNAEVDTFFGEFGREVPTAACDVLFAVPYTLLARAVGCAKPKGWVVAAQNVFYEKHGAFTGEISIPMLQELGVNATLIGHSERRQFFGETNASVAKKTVACLAAGFLPIVCVGETQEERAQNRTDAVLREQLNAVFKEVPDLGKTVIAYEPVWAIGTGLTATDQQAEQAHTFIRTEIRKRYGDAAAENTRILYGGSAKPDNIGGLLAQRNIDGALVGGASLKPLDFAAMVRVASNL